MGDVPVLPVTYVSFLRVSALFKAGKYKSFPGYVSRIKRLYTQEGHSWTSQLEDCKRWATTSFCTRMPWDMVRRGPGEPVRSFQADAVVKAPSLPYRADGSHAMRLTGAQLLAVMGLDPIMIGMHGRWSSSAILSILAESPLLSFLLVLKSSPSLPSRYRLWLTKSHL